MPSDIKKRARIWEVISYMNTVLRDVDEIWLQFTSRSEKPIASSTTKTKAEISTEICKIYIKQHGVSTKRE